LTEFRPTKKKKIISGAKTLSRNRAERGVGCRLHYTKTLKTPRVELCRLTTNEEGQFPPFPITVHVLVSDISQPPKLGFNVQKLVRWIFVFAADVHCFEKAFVDLGVWRCYMFQVAKHASRFQYLPNFSINGSLPFVAAMMNRKARSNDVKGSEIWKRRIQIVHDQLNSRLAGESALRLAQHRWRKIQANAGSFVAMRQQQCEQMTVAATQIEDTLRMLGYFGDKSCFAFLSMRDIFEPPQVVKRMIRSGPLVGHVHSLKTAWISLAYCAPGRIAHCAQKILMMSSTMAMPVTRMSFSGVMKPHSWTIATPVIRPKPMPFKRPNSAPAQNRRPACAQMRAPRGMPKNEGLSETGLVLCC
jgi:hypothetical protein